MDEVDKELSALNPTGAAWQNTWRVEQEVEQFKDESFWFCVDGVAV